jgi:hypothetical protein
MPFSPRTHKSTSHQLWEFAGNITTRSSTIYKRPLKPKISVYDNKGINLIYEYDVFNPHITTDIMTGANRHHPLTNLQVTIGKNNNAASYTILDEDVTWSRKLASEGNIIRITAGKTTGTRKFLFKGRVKKMRPKHIGNRKRQLTFSAIGEKAETNNVLVTYQRAAASIQLDTDTIIPRVPDSEMTVWKLVKNLLESLGVQVTNPRQSIKDRLLINTSSGISPEVDIRILSVSFIDVELSTVLNFFSEITGAYWDIRDGLFIFEYPKLKHSGIVLKARTNESSSDLADSTGYFVGDDGWEYEESIDKNDGYMTDVTAKTIISTKSVANETESVRKKYVTALYKTFLAVQFEALDSRFITVRMTLSRIGDPRGGINDPENPIKLIGQIITDNNNNPTGSLVCEFEIPFESLTADPTDVFINDLHVDPSVSSPNTKYWLRLKPIGVGRGDTVRWHHDNNVSEIGRYSAYAIGDFNDIPNWKVSERGPMYNFTVFSKIQRLQFYSNKDAAERYNQTDSSIDVTYLEDVESVGKLAQMELAIRSNPVRVYDAKQVMIPNNKIYYPGEMVTIVDPVLGLDENENVEAEIQEIDYSFEPSDLGLRYVSLKPLGEYVYKIEDLPT